MNRYHARMADEPQDELVRLLARVSGENTRNDRLLHLTANEGLMSRTARAPLSWNLSDRYIYARSNDVVVDNGRFAGVGLPGITELSERAEAAVNSMLGGAESTIHCLSGIHAMLSAIATSTRPNDVVLSFELNNGGHFVTANLVQQLGRKHAYIKCVDGQNTIDIERTADLFNNLKARAVYLDASYFIEPHKVKELRSALGPDAVIIYDASHVAGLLMGGRFQSPFLEGADVICANTHKTLPGPQKGLISFARTQSAMPGVDDVNFKLFSSPHIHHVISLAITIFEMKQFGQAYARDVIANANAIGAAFTEMGYEVRTTTSGDFTENHQTHVFVDRFNLSAGELLERLLRNGISTSFNRVLGGRLFIRFGSQEITRRGFAENEIGRLADLIHKALNGLDVSNDVQELHHSFPNVCYSFDNQRPFNVDEPEIAQVDETLATASS